MTLRRRHLCSSFSLLWLSYSTRWGEELNASDTDLAGREHLNSCEIQTHTVCWSDYILLMLPLACYGSQRFSMSMCWGESSRFTKVDVSTFPLVCFAVYWNIQNMVVYKGFDLDAGDRPTAVRRPETRVYLKREHLQHLHSKISDIIAIKKHSRHLVTWCHLHTLSAPAVQKEDRDRYHSAVSREVRQRRQRFEASTGESFAWNHTNPWTEEKAVGSVFKISWS